MKITYRSLHRDLGFFYLGLIISFAISGLFLTHRKHWKPQKYPYETIGVQVPSKFLTAELTKPQMAKISDFLKIEDHLKRFGVEKNKVWVTYDDSDLQFDKETGKGQLKKFKMTPILGQMTQLHLSTNTFWIYYVNGFAISLLIIVFSAIMFSKGKYGFKEYGWKLTLAGLLIPIGFIVFLAF